MRQVVFVLVTGFFAALAWSLAHSIPSSGVLADLEPKLVDQCRRIDVAPGTEDIAIDLELNLAFISAADRRAWYNETENARTSPKNGIYTLALDGSDTVTRVLPEIENFLPHGISLWTGENGDKRLFVINHPSNGGEIVEIFSVGDGGALTHLESVSFTAMHSPNDVVAVGPRQFYASNDRGYEEGLMATLESYMALPFSSLVYFDGDDGRIIQKGMTYANGINQSHDGKTLYVAEVLKRRIAVFDRDIATGALTWRTTFKANTAPDNIDVAADGALWIGGHSKIFDFLAHAKDASNIAPSHVVRIDPATGAFEDIFISLDGEINGSSVGAASEDTLIVGAVFDGHVMVCPLG